MKKLILCLIFSLFLTNVEAQKKVNEVIETLEAKSETYGNIAQKIWEMAEMGYLEEESAALIQKVLADEGFSITTGVAAIPTAFVAEYGGGSPVIAILGEYDALPGLSQQAVPEKSSAGKAAGHACGHHLFGTASAAAAIAVEDWIKANNSEGTVRFYGISAHAAGSPERGRSALDGVEAMNAMVNMMREHVPEQARIHYVITSGGKAPNVVPDFAEVYYYARHNKREVVIGIFDRIIKAAEGAALGTGTAMDYEMIGGTHELLPNTNLQSLMHNNLSKIGGITYTPEELDFANKIAQSLGYDSADQEVAKSVQPYTANPKAYGSTDVGDVSFTVPTVGMNAANWVPGTPAHSWQAVAAGGTTIDRKGMMVAAKTLTLTAIDLLKDKELVSKARAEFIARGGSEFKYIPLLGDRPPALDYRK
ncbi:MAG: peptidase dimerization domain-containing protein [Eudoraea sp.]|nr:peptidase dimerization domain-containing protein [Eudoraea sp.]